MRGKPLSASAKNVGGMLSSTESGLRGSLMIDIIALCISIASFAGVTWVIRFGTASGAKGDRGEQGPKGDRGEQGPKGDRGSQGLRGESCLKEMEENLRTLRSNLLKEITSYRSCQCSNQNCHLGVCTRPVRYLLTDINRVLCGNCYLMMKEFGYEGPCENLHPSKPASFRRPAYKNHEDEFGR